MHCGQRQLSRNQILWKELDFPSSKVMVIVPVEGVHFPLKLRPKEGKVINRPTRHICAKWPIPEKSDLISEHTTIMLWLIINEGSSRNSKMRDHLAQFSLTAIMDERFKVFTFQKFVLTVQFRICRS